MCQYAEYLFVSYINWGRQWRSWLMGSLEFFIDNLCSKNMAAGSTQPVTKTRTTIVSWGKGDQCIRLKNLVLSYADFLELLGASKF